MPSPVRRLLSRPPVDLQPHERDALVRGLRLAADRQRALANGCDLIRHVSEFLADDEGFWYVESPGDAPDLESLLTRAPFEPHLVARYGVQVCDALLHGCYPGSGETRPHGTVRPKSIFLADGRLSISDFGVAAAFSEALNPEAPMEELDQLAPYTPPELWLSPGTYGELRDEFAVGVILFELATGHHPFGVDRTDVLACHQRILTGRNRPATKLKPDLDAGFASILDRAVSKFEENRFQSLREFREALATFAGPDPVEEVLAAVRAAMGSKDPRTMEKVLADVDRVANSAEGRLQKPTLEAARNRLEHALICLLAREAIQASQLDEAAQLAERLRPHHSAQADELLRQIGELRRARLREELARLGQSRLNEVSQLLSVRTAIAAIHSSPHADDGTRTQAQNLERKITSDFVQRAIAEVDALLQRDKIDAAERAFQPLATLNDLSESDVGQRQRTAEAIAQAKAKWRERVAAEIAKAKVWCERFKALVDANDLQGATSHLQDRPKTLADWPEELLTIEKRCRSRLAELEQEERERAVAEGHARFRDWLRSVEAEVSAGRCGAADELFHQPPGIQHPPPNAERDLERVRQAIAGCFTRREHDKAVDDDERRARAWIGPLQNLVDAGQVDAAAKYLETRPKIEFWPEDVLSAEAKCRTEIEARQAEHRRREIEKDHAEARDWLAAIRKAVDAGQWTEAGKLLDHPPAITNKPADFATQVDRLRRTVREGAAEAKRVEQVETDRHDAEAWIGRFETILSADQLVDAVRWRRERPALTHWPVEVLQREKELSAQLQQKLRQRRRKGLDDLVREVAQRPNVRAANVTPQLLRARGDELLENAVIVLRPPKPYRALSLRARWNADRLTVEKEAAWEKRLAAFPEERIVTLRRALTTVGAVTSVVVLLLAFSPGKITLQEAIQGTHRFVSEGVPAGYVVETVGPPEEVVTVDGYLRDSDKVPVVRLDLTGLGSERFVFSVPRRPDDWGKLVGSREEGGDAITLRALRDGVRSMVIAAQQKHYREAINALSGLFSGLIPGWDAVDLDAPPPSDLSGPLHVPLRTTWPIPSSPQSIELRANSDGHGWEVPDQPTEVMRVLANQVRTTLRDAALRQLKSTVADIPVAGDVTVAGFVDPSSLRVNAECSEHRLEADGWKMSCVLSVGLMDSPSSLEGSLGMVALAVREQNPSASIPKDRIGEVTEGLRHWIARIQRKAVGGVFEELTSRVFRSLKWSGPGEQSEDELLPTPSLDLSVSLWTEAEPLATTIRWDRTARAWRLTDAKAFQNRYVLMVGERVKSLAEEALPDGFPKAGPIVVSPPTLQEEAGSGRIVGITVDAQVNVTGFDRPLAFPFRYPEVEERNAPRLIRFGRIVGVWKQVADLVLGAGCKLKIADQTKTEDLLVFLIKPEGQDATQGPVEARFRWEEDGRKFVCDPEESKLKEQVQGLCPGCWSKIAQDGQLWGDVLAALNDKGCPAGHWLSGPETWTGFKLTAVGDGHPDQKSGRWILGAPYPWSDGGLFLNTMRQSCEVAPNMKTLVDNDETSTACGKDATKAVAWFSERLCEATQNKACEFLAEATDYATLTELGFLLERRPGDDRVPVLQDKLYRLGRESTGKVIETLKSLTGGHLALMARGDTLQRGDDGVQIEGRVSVQLQPDHRLQGRGWTAQLATILQGEPSAGLTFRVSLPLRDGDDFAIEFGEFMREMEWIQQVNHALAHADERVTLEGELQAALGGKAIAPIANKQALDWVKRLDSIKRSRSPGNARNIDSLERLTEVHRQQPAHGRGQVNQDRTHFVELFWGVEAGFAIVWISPIVNGAAVPENCIFAVALDRSAQFSPLVRAMSTEECTDGIFGVVFGLDGQWTDKDISVAKTSVAKTGQPARLDKVKFRSAGSPDTAVEISKWDDLEDGGKQRPQPEKMRTGLWFVRSLLEPEVPAEEDAEAARIAATCLQPESRP